MDSQVNASLHNQNLRTDLRMMAKHLGPQVHASRKKPVNFTHTCIQMTCETLVSIAYEIELDQSQRKSAQVGGQTKRKL